MRRLRAVPFLLLTAPLAGCGGGEYFRPVSDIPVRIGPPYTVRGVTYVPAANASYDEVGYATWYGNKSGNKTASGERFQARWITAAHTTLPLPGYVEVTSLETGKRIIVRVNDRGAVLGPQADHRLVARRGGGTWHQVHRGGSRSRDPAVGEGSPALARGQARPAARSGIREQAQAIARAAGGWGLNLLVVRIDLRVALEHRVPVLDDLAVLDAVEVEPGRIVGLPSRLFRGVRRRWLPVALGDKLDQRQLEQSWIGRSGRVLRI